MTSGRQVCEKVFYGSSEAETERRFPTRYRRFGASSDLSQKDPKKAKKEHWPKSWSGLCLYDSFPFSGPPLPLVLGEDTDTGQFKVSFAVAFCCKECEFAYLQEKASTERARRQIDSFMAFVRKELKDNKPFYAAPSKLLMKCYSPEIGQFDTIEQWRAAAKRSVVVVPTSFPYVPESMVFEEKKMESGDGSGWVFEDSRFQDPPVKQRIPVREIAKEVQKGYEKTGVLTTDKYDARGTKRKKGLLEERLEQARKQKTRVTKAGPSKKGKEPEPEESESEPEYSDPEEESEEEEE